MIDRMNAQAAKKLRDPLRRETMVEIRELKRFVKFIALTLITSMILFVAASSGPLSHLPTIIMPNERYFSQVRNHELLLGFSGFVIALVAGTFLQQKFWTSASAAIFGGGIYYVAAQAGDAGPVSELLDGLPEFFLNYLFAGVCVVLAFLGAAKVWRKS